VYEEKKKKVKKNIKTKIINAIIYIY